MEAKDTVMSTEQIKGIFKGKVIFASSPEMEKEAMANLVAEAQAEISFKAGEQSGYDKGYSQAKADRLFIAEEHRKAGIREVVEEVEKNPFQYFKATWSPFERQFTGDVEVREKEWQVKLKEWGIEL